MANLSLLLLAALVLTVMIPSLNPLILPVGFTWLASAVWAGILLVIESIKEGKDGRHNP